MFQNIVDEEKVGTSAEVEEDKKGKVDVKGTLKKLFTKQNILLYIVSFMLSTVSTTNDMAPFGLAIFAAVLSNGLPAGVVFIISMIRYINWNGRRRDFNIYIDIACVYRFGFDFQTMV